jgi:predicted porin
MNALADTVGSGQASSTMSTEGASAAEYGSFDRRQGNNFQYWSPAVYNTTFRFMYSANADRTTTTTTATRNPDLLSASLTYDDGALMAGASWEQHDDYFTTTGAPVTGVTGNSSKDTGLKLAARYKFDFGTTLGAYWDSLKYKQTTGAGDSKYSRASYGVTVTHPINDFMVRAGWTHATNGTCDKADGSSCSVSGLSANHLAVGGSYSLSKRTNVYAIFSRIWNGNNNYNFIVNGVNSTLPAGADPQAIGLGIRHTF